MRLKRTDDHHVELETTLQELVLDLAGDSCLHQLIAFILSYEARKTLASGKTDDPPLGP